jgi:LuxR family maltose regulon positive regulatory protein
MLPMGQFQAAEAYAELAQDLLAADAPPLDRAVLICLRIYVAQAKSDLAQVIELSRQALQLLEEGDPYFLRGAVLANLAQAQTAMGDIPAATHTLGEMVRLSRQVGHHLSAVSAMGSLASFLNLQGRRREAMARCQQAFDEAVDNRGRPLPPAGQVHIVLGTIYYDADELARARQHLVQGLRLGEQVGPAAGGVLTGRVALAQLQQAMGEEEAALATIGEVRHIASQFNMPQADAFVAGAEADIQLKQGNVVAAERWAETAGLSPTDSPDHLSESDFFTYARLLLAQNRPGEAQTLLANCERFALSGGRQRSLIIVRILQALSEGVMGRRESALGYLEEAVRLAAPEGYRRAFLEEGRVVAELLPRVRHAAPDFVDQLLATGGMEVRPPVAAQAQPLEEPLSERELEVLALVVAGLTNREIAERLFISVGTVKTHVHNIYGKLGVSSRPMTISRSRKLGLI